jgi:curved DNA-binding protein
MNYHDILGVKPGATPEEIKSAYKKLVKKHHPDLGGDPEEFKRINEAYEKLSNPQPQQQFNNESSFSFNFDPSDMESMFSAIFGGNRRPKNRDIKLAVTISLEDLAKAEPLTINYNLLNGQTASAEIYIHPGVEHGAAIKYPQLGDNSLSGIPRGDLIIYVKVLNHHKFERDGLNLKHTIIVDTLDLILGKQIEIETIQKKPILLNIPAGTNPNTTLNVAGYGLSDPQIGKSGNLYIVVKGKTPKVTNEDLIKRIKEINDQINSVTK